jgi:hypothetical protein
VRLRNYLLEYKKYQQAFLTPLPGIQNLAAMLRNVNKHFWCHCLGSNWRKDFDIELDVCYSSLPLAFVGL